MLEGVEHATAGGHLMSVTLETRRRPYGGGEDVERGWRQRFSGRGRGRLGLVLGLVAWAIAVVAMIDPVYEAEGSLLVTSSPLGDVLGGDGELPASPPLTSQALTNSLTGTARLLSSELDGVAVIDVALDTNGYISIHVEGVTDAAVDAALDDMLGQADALAARQSYVSVVYRTPSEALPDSSGSGASALLGVSSPAEPRELLQRPPTEYLMRVARALIEGERDRQPVQLSADTQIELAQTAYDQAPILDVVVTGPSRGEALAGLDQVTAGLNRIVRSVESDLNISANVGSRVVPVNQPTAATLRVDGLIGPFFHIAGLVLVAGFLGATWLDRAVVPSPARLQDLGRSGPSRVDGFTLLIVSVWLLFLLPARLVITPLGGIGQPALLMAMVAAVMWAFGRIHPAARLDAAPNPVRWVLGLYVAYLGMNYVLLQTRVQSELEASSSTRYVLVTVALVGAALLIIDACHDRSRLHALIRALVHGAFAASVIAFLQSFLDLDLPSFVQIPGLSFSTELGGIDTRGSLNRPRGTMSHPIEMGVVLGAMVPLAVHHARYLSRRPQIAWLVTGVIATAAVLSVSRAAVLGAVFGLGVLGLAWSWRQRTNAVLAAAGLVGAMWAVVPGLITTFWWFFANIGTEGSAQARIDRFPMVMEIFAQRPWFGHGAGTFTVEEGALLDQQIYQAIIELGIIGTIITLTLLAVPMAMGVATWRGTRDPEVAHLTLALTGTLVALALTSMMYTAFWYRVHLTLMFLVIGCIGCIWRIARRDAVALSSSSAAPAEAAASSESTSRGEVPG